MKHKILLLVVLLLGLALALSACATEAPECPECPEVQCPDCPDCPEAPECPECPEVECPGPVGGEVPFEALWAGSGHADATAAAFRHWDEDDPAVVPASCAKCHSAAGYLDFLGADGSAAGMIDAEVPALEVMGVTCVACHNDVASEKTSVVMPSGIELTNLGDESRCMECHQGRQSKVSVDAAVAELAGVTIEEVATVDQDAVLEGLGFRNVHYYPAAATKYGTYAMGGYEYPGKSYDGNFAHVEAYDTCIECHNPHTLEIEAQGCVMCHGEGDFADYRTEGSLVDYDGDGDMDEGVAFEITTLQEILYAEMQAYADNVTGTGLSYDSAAFPYFFDGAGERLGTWTPRLLHAAYNYQLSLKDPGGYAHNGKYIIQLLFDSIEDLNPEAAAGLYRIDHGHFAGSEGAFRHWDEDGEVPASCAKCHSATGLPTFAKEGVNISAEISNGFQCVTCHGGGEFPELFAFETVTFPSGAEVTVEAGDPSGLCMQCHQGRSSGVAVANAIGDQPRDELGQGLRFLNIHYFAAGATRFGSEVTGMYEFEGQDYVGLFEHVPGFQTCAQCHDAHALEVKTETCFTCHGGADELTAIRISETDFDGDGDVTEGLAGEIETLTEALYAAMQAYTAANDATDGIVYASYAYPYYFADTNGNGEADREEANYGNSYKTWTPNLLIAAYNYQYVLKDPGAFAHNGEYVIQVLIDTIEALGGDVTLYTRPAVEAVE